MTERLANPFPEYRDWLVRPLARGHQASLLLLTDPQEGSRVVVKCFTPPAGGDAAIRRETEALDKLASLACEARVEGWRVVSPRVLGISHTPPALALTYISGEQLDRLLIDGTQEPPVPSVVPRVLARSIWSYWSSTGAIIGDMNLQNIICDIPGRTIGIVDPGAPYGWFSLPMIPMRHYPISRDLGYLLYEVCSTNVKLTLRGRAAPRRRLCFVRSLLAEIMERTADPGGLIDEIGKCAIAHAERLNTGLSPRRCWRKVVQLGALAEIRNQTQLTLGPAFVA